MQALSIELLAWFMKSLILYFSRSGNTRKVAEQLASELNSEIEAIRCSRYSGSWIGYARAGYDSLRKVRPAIEPIKSDLTQFDRLILGTPIWTSYPSTPVRAFLDRYRELPERVALFMTQGGQSAPAVAARLVTDAISRDLEASLSIMGSDAGSTAANAKVSAFIQSLAT